MTGSYRPSGVSRFLAWIDTLPGHGWWAYPAIGVVLFAWSQGIIWATGQRPFGTLEPLVATGVFYAPYTLAALAYINRTSQRALATFWPATGWPDDQQEAWRYQFVNSPSGFGLPAIIIGVIFAIGAFVSAPASALGAESNRAVLFAAYFPSAVFGYALVFVAVIHTSRQLRLVARIHREAEAIDPFDRGPVYAFSQLTVRTGLAFVLSGYYAVTVNGAFQAGNVIATVALAVTFGGGLACFVLPLWGIHDRLVHEKEVLLHDVEIRVGRLGAEMYARIDAGQFEATKVVSDAIAGAQTLRERIARLPTWPWPPQVLRGFLSALLLPVAVYLISRLAATQIGA